MAQKIAPLNYTRAEQLAKKYPTPWHIYHEKGIREGIRKLNTAFSWVPEFKNFFAVKALPNHHIVKISKEEKGGADCSSMAELRLASEKAGVKGEDIMFTSNATPPEEYVKARELGAIINLDDITHIPFLEKHASLPGLICFRYNPGPLREGNSIIGNPEEAKYGFTKAQLFEGYKIMKRKGVKRFGLHTMVASNELNPQYFVETARMLFELVVDISRDIGVKFEFINMGGGIGIPYKPEQDPIDLNTISQGVKKLYYEMIVSNNLHPLKIFMENGRSITGPHGWLYTRVLHTKSIYKNYICVDACMADHMRPGMYGAYHHIIPIGKEHLPFDHKYDVVGSLCENNDKFAIDRPLPEIVPGNLLANCDTGAHSRAMGFNYNGKYRCGELLIKPNWEIKMIRRSETYEDYIATLVD